MQTVHGESRHCLLQWQHISLLAMYKHMYS